MLTSIISLLFLGVGYGPPSQINVLEVLQTRFHSPKGDYLDPVINADNYELRFTNYPVDAVLQHCDPFEVEGNGTRERNQPFRKGYRCLVEVIPYAVPAYYLSGIFAYDGLTWIYIGHTEPRGISPHETINRKNAIRDGRNILKPGSIPYDRYPEFPINDVPSPYDKLLNVDRATSPF